MRAFFTGSLSGSLVTIPSIAARFDEGVAADGFWATVLPANRINQHAKTNFMEMVRPGELLPDRDAVASPFYRAHRQRQSLISSAIWGVQKRRANCRTANVEHVARVNVGMAAFVRPPS
jgi:hypothetical protein